MSKTYAVCPVHGAFDGEVDHCLYQYCPMCKAKLKIESTPDWLYRGALVMFHPTVGDPNPIPVRVTNDPTPHRIEFVCIGQPRRCFKGDSTRLRAISKLDLSRFQSCPIEREWATTVWKKGEAMRR